jgi:hypothetical protein
VEWVRPSQVARDDCNGSADFDGDGELDRFAWVERDGLSGLRIERSAGPAAVLGAGAHLHIDPWGGEPGFTRHGESLNGIVRVQTAAWTGEHWELPGGSIHTPTVITGIAGDALVWTSQRGHSDLVFLANGSWHLSAVRFPWESVRVLDVHMSGEWMWSPPPLPELRSHVRPSALDERTLQIYKPGPIPVPGAYPGQTREFYVGYPPQPLPN